MRRLSLSLFMLALAGLLLVACDPRREQEVDVSEAESAEDCAAVTPVVTSSEAPLAAPAETPLTDGTSTPAVSPTISPNEVEETASPQATDTPTATEAAACPETSPAPANPTLTTTPEPTEGVAEWPAGGLIVFTRATFSQLKGRSIQKLWRAAIDGSNQTEVAPPDGCDEIHTFDLSPSGSHIAFMCPNDATTASLYVFRAADQTSILISTTAAPGNAYWAPEGTTLAYVSADRSLHTVSGDGSADQNWGPQPSGYLVGWTLDGRVVFDGAFGPCDPDPPAYCRPQSVILDLATHERVELLDIKALDAWSPDGRYVLAWVDRAFPGRPAEFSALHAATELIDLITGERQRVSMDDANVWPSLWLPDGQSFLVSALKTGEPYTPVVCSTWRVDVSDTSARSEFLSGICGPAYFSRDGIFLYSARDPLPGPPDQGSVIYRIDLRNPKAEVWISGVVNAEFYEPAP